MSDYVPRYYSEINTYNASLSPSTVHVKNTALAQFFKRYLLQEAMSVFEWQMPEEWDRSYFLYVLYVMGYIAIINTDRYGVIPQHGGLGGYNVFYAPKYMVINNPLIRGTLQPEIGVDCVALRLEPDWLGLYDIVDFYGDMMALTAETAGVNILNSKLSYVFAADNKASAESYKHLYDELSVGNPAAVVDKELLDEDGSLRVQLFNQNVGQNFIADRLLDVLRDIRCMFLTDIGIPNANTQKRERLISDEVNANNGETRSKCVLWLAELKRGCKQAREMFGIDLDVNWRKDLIGDNQETEVEEVAVNDQI